VTYGGPSIGAWPVCGEYCGLDSASGSWFIPTDWNAPGEVADQEGNIYLRAET